MSDVSPQMLGKFRLVYEALRKTGDPTKDKRLKAMPAALRRRLLVDFDKRIESASLNFELATKGTILDPMNLKRKGDGAFVPPHDLAIAYPEEFHKFVIGDIRFDINPLNIQISDNSHSRKDFVIRSRGMTKSKSGHGVIFCSVQLPFVGTEAINTKLRRLIAFVRTMPILYIDNEKIRQHVWPDSRTKSMACAVTHALVTPMPGALDTLICQLSLEIFNYLPFSDNFMFMFGPAAMLQDHKVKLHISGKSKTTSIKLQQDELMKQIGVMRPDQSIMFRSYYDAILGDSFGTSQVAPSAASRHANNKDAAKKMSFVKNMSGNYYNFKRVGGELNSTITFQYYVYTTVHEERVAKSAQSKATQRTPRVNTGPGFGSLSAFPMPTQRKLPALSMAQKLGYRTSGSITGTRLHQAQIIAAAEFYKGTQYSSKKASKSRDDETGQDCSSFIYQAVKRSGLGNIGVWGYGQVRELERMNSMGMRALLRVPAPNGHVLIPMPLEIVSFAENSSPSKQEKYRNSIFILSNKVMGIPGVILHSWGERSLYRHSGGQKMFAPRHAMMGHHIDNNGGVYVIDQAGEVEVRKMRHSQLPGAPSDFNTWYRAIIRHLSFRNAWYHHNAQSAYLLPNVIYDYTGPYKAVFDGIFAHNSDIPEWAKAKQQVSLVTQTMPSYIKNSKNRDQLVQRLMAKLNDGLGQGGNNSIVLSGSANKAAMVKLYNKIKANQATRADHVQWKNALDQVAKRNPSLKADIQKIYDITVQMLGNHAQLANLRKTTPQSAGMANPGAQAGSDVRWLDPYYRKRQIIRATEAATKRLQGWIQKVQEFIKKTGNVWQLCWMRDGAAVLRRPVSLTIQPGVPVFMNDGQPHYLSLVSASVGLSNIFARIPILSHRLATHQYMGSGDSDVTLSFQSVGNGQIARLQYMHSYNEAATRYLRRVPDVGVIYVTNDIVNLCGSETYIVDSMEDRSIEGNPGSYGLTLKLTEWKKNQEARSALAQEFHTSIDTRRKYINELGRLFSINNYFYRTRERQDHSRPGIYRDVRIVDVVDIVWQNKVRIDFTMIRKMSKDQTLLNQVAKQYNVDVTTLTTAYVAFAPIIASAIRKLTKTGIFKFLGYTKDDLKKAISDPNHPFNVFGFFGSVLRSSGVLDNEFANARYTTPKAQLVYQMFLNRVMKLNEQYEDVDADERGRYYPGAPIEVLRKRLSKRIAFGQEQSSAIEQVKKFVFARHPKVKYQSTLYRRIFGHSGGAQSIRAQKILNFEFGSGDFDSAGNYGWVGYFASKLRGWTSTAQSLWKWVSGQSSSSPEGKFLMKLLGPGATKVQAQYENFSAQISSGIRFDSQIPTMVRSVNRVQVSLRSEVKFQQLRGAASLLLFFQKLRNEIAGLAVTLQRVLQLDPHFEQIFSQESEHNLAYRGLPAYQDIPLPRFKINRLSSAANQQNKKQPESLDYRWANPDFYFFNPDDFSMMSLDMMAKASAQALILLKSSHGFAQQFGMMPFRKDEQADFLKKTKGNRNKAKDNQSLPGVPGFYAYLGSRFSKHEGQLGKAGANLSRNLPESLALELGQQALTRTVTAGKAANGYVNLGVSDAGMTQEKSVATWYLDMDGTKTDAMKQGIRMDNHPLNLQNVHFGPTGMSELRLPVLIDRKPESLIQQFTKSAISSTRNMFKMRRALPAFKLYFIEDDTSGYFGTDKNSYRLSYDDFFSYSAIKEIKFVASRKIPADLIIIRLSNTLGYLDTLEFSHGSPGTTNGQQARMPIATSSSGARQTIDPLKQDTELENPFTRFVLKAGVRVQFRMDYENNPEDMETLFNGQIVQINAVNADEVVIVCQSFATQLVAFQKGLDHKTVPKKWVDTFDLLSWAMCQPEVTYFGRWSLNAKRSIGESRSTGGWEKVFTFLADPRDDNIFAPARHEVIRLYSDDMGGIWSFLKSITIRDVIKVATLGMAGGNASTRTISDQLGRKTTGKVTYMRTVGDADVMLVEMSGFPIWDVRTGSISLQQHKATVPLVVEKNNRNPNLKAGQTQAKKGKVVSFHTSHGRGDSAILDYHVYRTTIWDIFQEMMLRHPGWIARPVPYGDRMTMFFGQPTQLYWSRPMTQLENMQQIRNEREVRKKILKNKEWKNIYQSALGYSTSGWRKFARWGPVQWVMRNPLDAFLWGTTVIGVGLGARALFSGGRAAIGMLWEKGFKHVILAARNRLLAGRVLSGVTASVYGGSKLRILGQGLLTIPRAAGAFGRAAFFRVGGRLRWLQTGVNWMLGGGIGLGILMRMSLNKQDELVSHMLLSQVQSQLAQNSLRRALAGRLIPFRRYHMVTSEHHIVANNIKASVHGTYNAVSLEFTADQEDKDVDLSRPRGSVETMTMKASDRILDKDVRMGHFSYPNCRGRWMASRYMQGLLLNYMKDIYKGSLVIMGDPKIRPYDRVMIFDSYSEMYGGIDVERVIHTLSPEVGCLTDITPDLVVYGNNITDMPYDDYMAAKVAWRETTWRHAMDALVRFQGSDYQKILKRAGGTSGVANQRYYRHITSNGFDRGAQVTEGSWWNLLGHMGAGFLGGMTFGGIGAGGGAIAGGLTYLARRMWGSGYKGWSQFIPFWGTMATKFYEWTTQRQPLIFQPLFVAGKPLIAGVDMDKVDMVQHMMDQFVPIRKAVNKGIGRLHALGSAILNQNTLRVVSSFQTGSGPSNSSNP